MFQLPPLLSIVENEDISADQLPPLESAFLVPRLKDKPQNPIMDSLNSLRDIRIVDVEEIRKDDVPEGIWPIKDAQVQLSEEVWERLCSYKANQSGVMSWDTLRKTFNSTSLPSAFLSQQNSQAFTSVRYYVRPFLQDPTVHIVYVTPTNLSRSLALTLTGTSSFLYIWDSSLEKFELRDIPNGKNGVMVLTGTDEVVSSSLVKRFLTIGTLMRRLETYITIERTRHKQVFHSFAHALSSILEHLRQAVISSYHSGADANEDVSEDIMTLTSLWTSYAEIEETLTSLASLCHREEDVSPADYVELSSSPSYLLTRVYQFLDDHLERRSFRGLSGILAYILTISSQDYFRDVCASVGYTCHNVTRSAAATGHFSEPSDNGFGPLDEDRREVLEDAFDEDGAEQVADPVFIPPQVSVALLRARRSLRLLRNAQPDNPLLTHQRDNPVIRWFWTSDEVKTAWEGQYRHAREPAYTLERPDSLAEGHRVYKDDLKQFLVFDLNPGSFLEPRSIPFSGRPARDTLRLFLDNFPSSLPPLTPTLPHLATLILSPLVHHVEDLSEALLSVFLAPATHLNLRRHLLLLRSYLLLTSHAFKSRLEAALFSDADEHVSDSTTPTTQGLPATGLRKAWAVGLSPALTEGDTWPPGGADLHFRLRTVIVDTLEIALDQSTTSGPQERVLQEAEWRLGFAIRDLPASTGKEKWLDPLSIEALDFLYMEYKPPRTLDVLIDPTVLSKYHRIFAFNLRLMRASNVVATLFRITRKAALPLFPTLSPSNKLLLHFRFVAQAFISSLSSYVYDKAIGANFDAFLNMLSEDQSAAWGMRREFPDIFALADHHSRVLDDILSACLLRSGQKAVGDLLRTCLELVLKLGILAGDLHRGRLQEYEAALTLSELWDQFTTKMSTLIKVLKALVDRGIATSRNSSEDVQAGLSQLSQAEGVIGNWGDLLIRLDVAEWWTRDRTRNRPAYRSV